MAHFCHVCGEPLIAGQDGTWNVPLYIFKYDSANFVPDMTCHECTVYLPELEDFGNLVWTDKLPQRPAPTVTPDMLKKVRGFPDVRRRIAINRLKGTYNELP